MQPIRNRHRCGRDARQVGGPADGEEAGNMGPPVPEGEDIDIVDVLVEVLMDDRPAGTATTTCLL